MMKYLQSRLGHASLLALTAGVALSLTSGPAFSLADGDEPVGLKGILRAEVPLGLYEDDFLELGESWESWSTGVAAEVTKLYEDDDLDLAGQKATVALLRKKLGTMEKALGDRRYRSIFEPLVRMHTRLNRRVTLAEAVLATLETNPATAHKERVEAARQAVVSDLDSLDSWLSNDIRNGKPWLKYVRADKIRALSGGSASMDDLTEAQAKLAGADSLNDGPQKEFMRRAKFVELRGSLDSYIALAQAEAPTVDQVTLRETLADLVDSVETWEEDQTSESASAVRSAYLKVRKQAGDEGRAIGAALASHYFNYNLRVVASEKFLNKVAGYEYTDEGPVDDFILGAKVDGHQTTTANVGIDLKADDKNATFNMTVRGVTQSRTVGVTDEARVNTSGYHTFFATKSVSFDGDKFWTADARISVNPSNTTTGVRTEYSSVPLFGAIADSIARGEVADRKGRSEAIAADRVRSRVLPEFNKEVDAEFKKYTDSISKDINPKLHEARLFPTARSYTSSDTEMWISTRLMDDVELGGDDPTFSTTSSKGIAIHLHETLINNSLGRMPIGGKTLNEKQLMVEISKSLKDLLGKEIALPKNEDSDPTQFVFPVKDFIRVRIDNGELILQLQAGLKTDNETIPTQRISMPLTFEIDGDNLVISAGDVAVSPVSRPRNPVVQIARAGIVRTKIQKALPTRKVDRKFDLKRDQGGPVDLAIAKIRPNAGWLSIVIE